MEEKNRSPENRRRYADSYFTYDISQRVIQDAQREMFQMSEGTFIHFETKNDVLEKQMTVVA
jgi:hypothetical protein